MKTRRDPLEIWKKHTGAVGQGRWCVPASRQQFYGTLLRLGSLWYRLQKAGLYWPPLLEVLKEIEMRLSQQLQAFEASLAIARPRTKKQIAELFHPSFYMLLREIKGFQPGFVWSDAHLEIREHRDSECNICAIELVWPAVIVYNGTLRSQDIGVHCLESLIEKMRRFLHRLDQEMQAIHVVR